MNHGATMGEPALRWLRRADAALSMAAGGGPRLGVLSGTFNPPTRAHLALAATALRALSLDEVLFILPEVPPHKGELEALLADRAEMLLRAVAAEPSLSAALCTHGLFLDVSRALEPHYPKSTRALFIAGRDAAERILLHWPYEDAGQALEEMFSRFEFAVAGRGRDFRVPGNSLAARYAEKIHSFRLPIECETVSATQVRERIAKRESIEDLVPATVAAYIRERGLYQPGRDGAL